MMNRIRALLAYLVIFAWVLALPQIARSESGSRPGLSPGTGEATLTPRLSAKAGLTWVAYKEGLGTDFTAVGVSAGATAWLLARPSSRIQVEGTLTALPVRDDGLSVPVRLAALEGTWIRDLGAGVEAQWHPWIGCGAFYKRMFVSGNTFGYTDLNGPVAVLGAERSFSGSSRARIELRFAAIFEDLLPMAPSNRELGLGFQWKKSLHGGRALGIAADWSELRVRIHQVQVESSSLGLGVSYEL